MIYANLLDIFENFINESGSAGAKIRFCTKSETTSKRDTTFHKEAFWGPCFTIIKR